MSLSHRIRRRVARRAERILSTLRLVEPRPVADDVVGPPLHAVAAAPAAEAPVVVEAPATPEPVVEPEPVVAVAADEGQRPLSMETVQEMFDDMVRPALQADGGDISLVKVEGGDVFVRLVGACSTCPSSTMTMRLGIERLLREEFEDFGDLIALGDYEV